MAVRNSHDLACWWRAIVRACWKQASAWGAVRDGLLQGLVWIAQPPQGPSGISVAHHPRVLPVAEGMDTMPMRVVEGNALCKMGLGSDKLSQIVHGVPEGIVGF